MASEVVNNNNSVPAVIEVKEDDDDEPPPPLPIKKSNNNLSNGVMSSPKDTDTIADQSCEEDIPPSEHTLPEGTPPLPLPVKVAAEETNATEGPDSNHQPEGNGESSPPPPLPVKVAEVPPPPPPEDDDSDGSPPPLPVKKELTPPSEPLSNATASSGNQAPTPPPPKDDDNDDEPPPPLPVRKSTPLEAPSSEVPVVSPPVEAPVDLPSENNVDVNHDVGSSSSSKLVPEVASSKVSHVPPPVPLRRTPVMQPQPKSVDSGKDDKAVNPPPVPNRVISVPPPPPPSTSSDSESEDEKTVQRPSLVTLKSERVEDENILLSTPKKCEGETSDSSDDDEECSLGTKIISQPSVDDDTIVLSSQGDMGKPLLSNGTKDDSLRNATKLPPPVRPRSTSKKVSSPSPPLLSPQHSNLSKSTSCDAILSVYSELGAETAAMYSQLGPEPAGMYSKLGPGEASMYSQVGPSSLYSTVGPGPTSMYSQVGPASSTVSAQVISIVYMRGVCVCVRVCVCVCVFMRVCMCVCMHV